MVSNAFNTKPFPNMIDHEMDSSMNSPWGDSGVFASAVDQFLGSLNLISALTQISNPGLNMTANKRRLARSVINRTMEMAGSLECYALETGDEILSAKVSLSPAIIARSWDPVISATAKSIFDIAEELIEAEAKEAGLCGITRERNQLLLNSIIAFAAAIGSEFEQDEFGPISLEAEFRRAHEILKGGIDPLLSAFKEESDSLFISYRQARDLSETLPQMIFSS